MALIDWIILLFYIAIILGLSYIIGRSQKDQEDYYLGGKKVSPWMAGSSMAANQVSAISLIGAPAFIAVKAGGGLRWLQYELAVPLAMAVIIIVLVPVFRKNSGVTIYQYMERRFGTGTRVVLSSIFLLSRSMATGVALLATAYVTSVCIGIPLYFTILLIGIISLVYTAMGGILADIYSDIIQLAVLWVSSIIVIVILYNLLNGAIAVPVSIRTQVFDIASSGTGSGSPYSLWPMLIGGLFLYISYYGCDQSQAQRLLSTETEKGAQKSLLINSMVRFPLVLTYCAIGLLLIPFLSTHSEFAAKVNSLPPDYLMPHFFNDYIPHGFLGIIVAGIFAASMSSLDSAINSLSAATWDDILIKIAPSLKKAGDKKKVFYSRAITVFWGAFAIICAMIMAGGPDTVLEMVNKIGSAFYGPIAGVFMLGIFTRKKGQVQALTSLFGGVLLNIILWIAFPSVSWMWWNVFGFVSTFAGGLLITAFIHSPEKFEGIDEDRGVLKEMRTTAPQKYVISLVLWFCIILSVCGFLHIFLN